jgi:hypothetical protein
MFSFRDRFYLLKFDTFPYLMLMVDQSLPTLLNLEFKILCFPSFFFLIWILVGRAEGKRLLGRPRRRCEDNIKMDLRERGIDGANWIRLARDRDRWRAFVNTEINLRLP